MRCLSRSPWTFQIEQACLVVSRESRYFSNERCWLFTASLPLRPIAFKCTLARILFSTKVLVPKFPSFAHQFCPALGYISCAGLWNSLPPTVHGRPQHLFSCASLTQRSRPAMQLCTQTFVQSFSSAYVVLHESSCCTVYWVLLLRNKLGTFCQWHYPPLGLILWCRRHGS
jgi:hypothetical protein